MARRELVAACGLIGALGGALFGYGLARPLHSYRGSWDMVLALTICTAISGTLLGLSLGRRPFSDAHQAGARATAHSFLFGGVNGALMVVAMAFFKGSIPGVETVMVLFFAAMFGGVCSIPFIPAMAAVAVAASRVDARPGSIAEAAQRRRIVRVAALCLSVAAIVLPARHGLPIWKHLPIHVTNLALAGIVALVAVELAVLASLRRRKFGPEWVTGVSNDAPPSIDFGVGTEVLIRRASDETYRTDAIAAEVVRGDRERAMGIVKGSLRGHLIAAAVAALSLFAQLAIHWSA